VVGRKLTQREIGIPGVEILSFVKCRLVGVGASMTVNQLLLEAEKALSLGLCEVEEGKTISLGVIHPNHRVLGPLRQVV
jgi:hypothetical protein